LRNSLKTRICLLLLFLCFRDGVIDGESCYRRGGV